MIRVKYFMWYHGSIMVAANGWCGADERGTPYTRTIIRCQLYEYILLYTYVESMVEYLVGSPEAVGSYHIDLSETLHLRV